MSSVVERLLLQNAGREPERLALKYAAMRRDAFAFLRGTCPLFYEDAPAEPALVEGPTAWLCGDLHLENFGTYLGDNRLTYFDINDFDEACIGPATLDVYRLLTSVVVGFTVLTRERDGAISLARRALETYAGALVTEKARWVERATARGIVRDLLRGLKRRKLVKLLDARTDERRGRRTIRLGRRALRASDAERERVLAFMETFARRQPLPAYFAPLDVARRVAGTGSLGLARFVVLVEGDGSPDRNHLLDLKLARPSCVPPATKGVAHTSGPFHTDAERIVFVERRMQAVAPAFLHAVEMGGEPFVLKELQPTEDRVDLVAAAGDAPTLVPFVETLGEVLAWAQLRSAGRAGTAEEDALASLARDTRRLDAVLELAVEASAHVTRQHLDYVEAYDAGAFRLDAGASSEASRGRRKARHGRR